MQFTETILLIIAAIITAGSTFFCLIGLATPGWYGYGYWYGSVGLYCSNCAKAPAALAIIALLLLIVGIVILVLFIIKILPKSIRVLSLLILFLATIFTLATFTSTVDSATGYSFKLMVFAHFLAYVATILVAFWLGGSYGTTVVTPTNP